MPRIVIKLALLVLLSPFGRAQSGDHNGNAVHPSGGSPWGMRLQIAFLFPKLTKEQQKLLLEQKLKQLEQEQSPGK